MTRSASDDDERGPGVTATSELAIDDTRTRGLVRMFVVAYEARDPRGGREREGRAERSGPHAARRSA